MPKFRYAATLPAQMTEMALAVPQVISHRVMRMALAGHQPSARDRREFHLMGAEKSDAFFESWWAMGMQAWTAQQQLGASMLRQAFLWPLTLLGGGRPGMSAATDMLQQWTRAGTGVLSHGLAPVHRRAVANAKRLAHTPLR